MSLEQIVMRIIGSINPVGETNTDDIRFKNLQTLCKLVLDLTSNIDSVIRENKDHYEYSRKRVADYAREFLIEELGVLELNS